MSGLRAAFVIGRIVLGRRHQVPQPHAVLSLTIGTGLTVLLVLLLGWRGWQTPSDLRERSIAMNLGDFGYGTSTQGGLVLMKTPTAISSEAGARPATRQQVPQPAEAEAPVRAEPKKSGAVASTAADAPPAKAAGTADRAGGRGAPSDRVGYGRSGTRGDKGGAFDIEGLNDRELLDSQLPVYPSGTQPVETAVTLTLWVAADGRVARVVPRQMGGNIRFTQEALKAVRTWRFSPLDPGTPDQTGQVTIYFRVE